MKRFLPLLVTVALVLGACQSRSLDPAGPYHGNETLATADEVIGKMYDVTDALLVVEMTHRSTLPKSAVTAANQIRVQAKHDLQAAVAARDVFEKSPTTENADALDKAIAIARVTLAVAETTLDAVVK